MDHEFTFAYPLDYPVSIEKSSKLFTQNILTGSAKLAQMFYDGMPLSEEIE
jgi:hypothetical protein